VTREKLKEMHWQVLPHPAYNPDLVSSYTHLFGTLKEALGFAKMAERSNHKLF
jgi:hypothetical protein